MANRTLRRRRPDQPRRIAYRVLRAVSEQDAYANLALAQALEGARLEPRDAAFVTELVAGTARLSGTYDAILAAASGRPRFEPALADALRLGAHQLLSMRVPTHAGVGATVDLAAAEVGEKVAGLTNAVQCRTPGRRQSPSRWARRTAGRCRTGQAGARAGPCPAPAPRGRPRRSAGAGPGRR